MHAVGFTRAASASTDGGDLDDEEWVDPTSVPTTPLDTTPPSKALFQRGTASAPVAPMMALKQQRKESQAPERSARTSNIAIDLGTIPVVVAEPGAGRGGGYTGGWGRWPFGAHTADEHGARAGWWADAEWWR